jgi:capsular polysaccharide export protein
MIAVYSHGIKDIPYLESFLGDNVALFPKLPDNSISAIAGWGNKSTAWKAQKKALLHDLPYISLEDGFLRSFGLGYQGYPPLSLVLDDVGIYYDATRPSALEDILNSDGWQTPELMGMAERVSGLIVQHSISKYNNSRPARSELFSTDSKKVLVVDQTYGDSSISGGLADTLSFETMIQAARTENPGAAIYVKIHPDVLAGKKKGYLTGIAPEPDTIVLGDDCNPHSILRHMDKVYVVTSQLGFEALLLGKEVLCFGVPFYAGWGLTDDRIHCPRRLAKRSCLEVFAAAFLKYARYIDPSSGRQGTILDVIDYLVRQKEWSGRNSTDYYCFGVQRWKRHYVRPFLQGIENKVVFVKTAEEARKKGFGARARIVSWGHSGDEEADKLGGNIFRVEDGFIRSVGLGSDLIRPMSLVLDSSGIYYDPRTPSDLENILNSFPFDNELVTRGLRLREMIIAASITKYNVDLLIPLRLADAKGRFVILVPGQVEDDASIRFGTTQLRTNRELLSYVREHHPDAYVIYKPHPDVLTRNRKGHIPDRVLRELCDHVETDHSVVSCIETADAVHTMTSLSGLDALIRGKAVYTYGMPFYAGWGLTSDSIAIPRRSRRISLDELIAGTLLVYPRYYDNKLKGFSECETVVSRIIDERKRLRGSNNEGFIPGRHWFVTRQFAKLYRLLEGWVHA